MRRKIGKANSIKATKVITNLIKSYGAIRSTAKSEWGFNDPVFNLDGTLGFFCAEENRFLMDTSAGILSLHISISADSRVYSVFGRFDDVKKANEFINGVNCTGRLNRHSGKFNFLYTSLADMTQSLHWELSNLVMNKHSVITDFADLEEMIGKHYDVEKAFFVLDDKFVSNKRICVIKPTSKNNFEFKNWRNKLIVMVDGVAFLVGKSSDFQLIWYGDRKEL